MINRNVENVSVGFFLLPVSMLKDKNNDTARSVAPPCADQVQYCLPHTSPPPPAHRRLVLVQRAVTATSAASELKD